jgi:mRNA interferase RelE/StbE
MHRLEYSPRSRDEIRKLDPEVALRIQDAIEEKLIEAPEIFGKPLRYSFKLLRALRVGDWRVLYRISGKTVYILAVLHRKEGYNK